MRLLRTFRRRGGLRTWLVNHDLRVLYACIPKAGCTSMKHWLVCSAGFAPELAEQIHQAERRGLLPLTPGYPNLHAHLEKHNSLRTHSARQVRRVLADPRYFKFTVVRHPLTRLVSGYLDKVVQAKMPAHRLIQAAQIRLGHFRWGNARRWLPGQRLLDPARSLSFREFVEQLLLERPAKIDPHFRSQSRLLEGITLDFTARLEHIGRDFAEIQRRLGVQAPLPNDKKQRPKQVAVTGCVADWPAARFRDGVHIDYRHFFDASLVAAAQQLFAADFARWQYHCDPSAADLVRAA